jgi:hypothetical protein
MGAEKPVIPPPPAPVSGECPKRKRRRIDGRTRRPNLKHGLYTLKTAVTALGSRALPSLRTALGRELREWRSALIADLGGEDSISTQQARSWTWRCAASCSWTASMPTCSSYSFPSICRDSLSRASGGYYARRNTCIVC